MRHSLCIYWILYIKVEWSNADYWSLWTRTGLFGRELSTVKLIIFSAFSLLLFVKCTWSAMPGHVISSMIAILIKWAKIPCSNMYSLTSLIRNHYNPEKSLNRKKSPSPSLHNTLPCIFYNLIRNQKAIPVYFIRTNF